MAPGKARRKMNKACISIYEDIAVKNSNRQPKNKKYIGKPYVAKKKLK